MPLDSGSSEQLFFIYKQFCIVAVICSVVWWSIINLSNSIELSGEYIFLVIVYYSLFSLYIKAQDLKQCVFSVSSVELAGI